MGDVPADQQGGDQIKESTNSWKVALRKTRNLTRWLELTREKKLKLAHSRGWISRLMLEHELAELSNRLAVKCWQKHAGKDTIKLMEKGKLKNMVIENRENIPMVQTRYKKKVSTYFGASELPLILASTNLGYLLCQDAHDSCHRGGDMALTVTKQVAYVMGAKKLLQTIRRKCMTCRKELAVPERQRMGDIPVE